jgi:hypothetical protein
MRLTVNITTRALSLGIFAILSGSLFPTVAQGDSRTRQQRKQDKIDARNEKGRIEHEDYKRMLYFFDPYFTEVRAALVPPARDLAAGSSQIDLAAEVSDNILEIVKELVADYACENSCISNSAKTAVMVMVESEAARLRPAYLAAASDLKIGHYHSVTGEIGRSVLYSEGSVFGTIFFAVSLPFTGAYDLTAGPLRHKNKSPSEPKILDQSFHDFKTQLHKNVNRYLANETKNLSCDY